ncbi:MAG: DinB family protein [Gemmatimonadales bacterium]
MESAVAPLAAVLELNTDLLLNCLEGLTDGEAQRRLAAGGNSVVFLAAHLADSRHFLAARLDRPLDNPLGSFLGKARGIDDIETWPTLAEVRGAWLAVSEHLLAVLDVVSAEELSTPNAHRFQISDTSRLGMIAFLTQHDSYHVGQLAFLRRQLGKSAMPYTRGVSRTA